MMDQKVKVEKKERAVARRHQRIWSFLWHTVAPLFKHIYHYSCELAPVIDGPCLVIPNHTMELDPVLVGMSFLSFYTGLLSRLQKSKALLTLLL